MDLARVSIKKVIIPALVVIALLVIPNYLLRSDQVYFLTTLCVPIVFAISYNMIYGYAGMLSLAHAVFFGTGAYAFYYSVSYTGNIIISIISSIIFTLILATLIGFISTRAKGAGFIVITLIMSVIFQKLANSYTSITGGSDGFFLPLPKLNLIIKKVSLSGLYPKYVLIMLITLGVFFLFRHILEYTTFGVILKGIRENEERMKSIGYNVDRYKLISFSIAGSFAGVAGMIQAMTLSFLSAESFDIVLSFNALVYCLLGGAGTLYGPVIGGAFMSSLTYYGSEFIEQYLILPGIVLIVLVLFYREGIMGLINRIKSE